MKTIQSFYKLMSRRLSIQLAVAGLLAAVVLSVFVTAIQLFLEVNAHKVTVNSDLERLIKSARLPAANAVFTYDYSLGNEIVESLLLNDFIIDVQLVDEQGVVLAEGQSNTEIGYQADYLEFLLGEPVQIRKIELQLSQKDPQLIGSLEMTYNYHQQFEPLMQATWQRLFLNLIEVSLLTIILIIVFNRRITQPLANLTRQLHGIESGYSHGQRLKLMYAHREDELGILIKTVNQQLQRLDILNQENQVSLDEAEQSYESLHTLVENLPHLISVKTPQGKPLLVNQAFLNAFSISADDYLHQNKHNSIFEGLTKSTRQLLLDADEEVANGHKAVMLPEVTWRLPNGKYLSLEMRKLSIQYKGQTAVLSVGVDITERKEHQAHIQHLAYHDALTDLPNRHLFIDRLEQALLRTQRSKQFGALIFVDLDNFKTINDTRGHLVGDTILAEVARRLKQAFREEDTVARLGGDEFVICMTDLGSSEEEANIIVSERSELLMNAMRESFSSQGEQINVSASLGLAYFHDHSLNASELLRHADMAMYKAKEAGKNQIIMFQQEMAEASQRLFELKEDTQKALYRDEFFLMYQPQVDSNDRTIIGAEALLRWTHPIRGLVSPGEFIPLLEESDLMPLVGQKVIDMAAEQLALWLKEGVIRESFKLSINVSPQQFSQADFATTVKSALDLHNIPANMIDLEITEGMIIDNIEHTVAAMNELRALGLHFSIDDFGTGYSNLNYLKRLPLDVLKVDQSFVRDIEHDTNDSAIVRTIIAMADQLKLSTIAEGVETEEQLLALRNMGCEIFQGYLYSPPLKNVEFATLMTGQDSNAS